MLCIVSPWPARTARGDSGAPRSHSLTVWSPTADASTCCAAGCHRTWPTLRGDAAMRSTGERSHGSHPSAFQSSNVDPSICQIITFPSSPADATIVSECGDQSVSRTGAVWLRASGTMSGSFQGIPAFPVKGDGAGRTANAPPPDEFQLMLMYVWVRVSTD